MKFQLKALVAALAIVAAVPAQAAMQTGTNGDSSLILTLVDSTSVVSATFDLGPTFTTFNRALNQSWDLTSTNYSAAWTAFNAAASAGKQWGIYMADGVGTGALEQQRFATSGLSTGLTTITNSQLGGDAANFDSFITASNNILPNGTNILNNHQQVADGSNFVSQLAATNAASGLSANAYSGNSGKIANRGSDANGAFDTNLFVWTLTRSSTNLVAQTTSAQLNVAGFNPYFNLSSNGILTYTASTAAPIPEPETYGMLLAGLGMIGFVARRRKSA
jgi:PEP-CTERM motif